jgi:predicted AlkP superfamily phosphohydrolase/phosphomutase
VSGPAVVVGLDGVPWRFIEQWTDQGHLPNFAKLRREGAAGPCRSTSPPLTALAWPSIATGVRADKHGIYAFSNLASDYTHSLNTSANCRHTSMWDYLRSVVVNVPMTYPASEVDGLMITGMMTPDDSPRFTHPRSLGDHIDAEYPGYETGLKWSEYQGRQDDLIDDIDAMLRTRRRLMVDLFDEDYELFFIVYTEPDRLQHLIWDEAVLRDHYTKLDAMLGDAIDHVEETGGTLYVVSDHGFGPITRTANLNSILRDAGMLEPAGESGLRGLLSKAGVNKERTLAALSRVGIQKNDIVRLLPETVVGSAAAAIPGDHGLFDVNHSETRAFAHGMGNIYVNTTERFDDGTVPPGERAAVKTELRSLFDSATDSATGEKPLTVVDGDEEFPNDPTAPDLVVEAADGYRIDTGSLPQSGFGEPDAYVADHKPEGIFLAWGPDVAAGTTPTDATVYDFTPTVLHGLGNPVPHDADGRVLTEIFDPDSPPANTDVERFDYESGDRAAATDGETDDDLSDVEDRLRGLGYME